jgi:tripartite-type tricarboxylate transporter receptor subunit TctC
MSRTIRVLIAAALAAPTLAIADYPDKPIKLVVPYPAGGVADILGRTYANKIKDQLGQPVLVDNKPGATGAIGSDAVAKAPGDGYTLLLNSSALVVNPWIVKQPFNFQKDLTPVARAAGTAYVVVIDAKLPIQNFEQFLAYAKKNPGKLGCATYGIGSPPHLALELLKQSAGLDILHVPYKTFAQALPDIATGQLGCAFDLPIQVDEFVKSGHLRAVAVTGDAVMAMFPQAEPFGKRFPEATVVGWQGIFAPATTPKPLLDKLRAEWAKALASPDIQQKIRENGQQPSIGTLDDFSREIASDYEKFGRVVKATGIKIE